MTAQANKLLRSAEDLVRSGLVADDRANDAHQVGERYAISISPTMARIIDQADPHDPIARQFIPDIRELDRHPLEENDPIGDAAHSPVEGVVHRYPDRLLLKVASVCPVYCRFCFRREMVGPQNGQSLSPEQFSNALDYIRDHSEVWEVILTGGDPLVLSDRRIAEVSAALSKIEHVKILRWHTRVPAVSPDRITNKLAAALSAPGKTVWIAVHANHARELTPQAREACRTLIGHGISLVSQTVLLRGVNDDPDTLADLMRAFVETGIKPYYLHHPDLAPGTAHLRVSIDQGQAIMRALRGRLSGLAQPTYVLDIPGGHGKVPIGPTYTEPGDEDEMRVTDWHGHRHRYDTNAKRPKPREQKHRA